MAAKEPRQREQRSEQEQEGKNDDFDKKIFVVAPEYCMLQKLEFVSAVERSDFSYIRD